MTIRLVLYLQCAAVIMYFSLPIEPPHMCEPGEPIVPRRCEICQGNSPISAFSPPIITGTMAFSSKGAGAAATPGTRTVGPRPPAHSATRIEVPVATNRAPQWVSGARDGADRARVRGRAAAAHLPGRPKVAADTAR